MACANGPIAISPSRDSPRGVSRPVRNSGCCDTSGDRSPTESLPMSSNCPIPPALAATERRCNARASFSAAAGWRMSGGVLVDSHGSPFKLQLLARTPANARTLLPYVDSLKRLGIDASMRIVDLAQFINLIRQREFDAVLREHGFVTPPTTQLRTYFGSYAAGEPMTNNLAGISDPVMDALIERAESAETLSAMTAACRALDRVLLWRLLQYPSGCDARAAHGVLGQVRTSGARRQRGLQSAAARRLVVRRRKGSDSSQGTQASAPKRTLC